VQIVGPIRSGYRWDGEIQNDQEWQLWIKTTGDRVAELTEWIKTNHSYDVPEVLAIPVTRQPGVLGVGNRRDPPRLNHLDIASAGESVRAGRRPDHPRYRSSAIGQLIVRPLVPLVIVCLTPLKVIPDRVPVIPRDTPASVRPTFLPSGA